MGKKKNSVPAVEEPKVVVEPKKPHRSGVGKQFYLDEDVSKALDDYLASRGELQPSQTRVFSLAIKMFLAKEGFWPPKPD